MSNEANIQDLNQQERNLLYEFFMWFRENGQKYQGLSIEGMIEIYLSQKK